MLLSVYMYKSLPFLRDLYSTAYYCGCRVLLKYKAQYLKGLKIKWFSNNKRVLEKFVIVEPLVRSFARHSGIVGSYTRFVSFVILYEFDVWLYAIDVQFLEVLLIKDYHQLQVFFKVIISSSSSYFSVHCILLFIIQVNVIRF